MRWVDAVIDAICNTTNNLGIFPKRFLNIKHQSCQRSMKITGRLTSIERLTSAPLGPNIGLL